MHSPKVHRFPIMFLKNGDSFKWSYNIVFYSFLTISSFRAWSNAGAVSFSPISIALYIFTTTVPCSKNVHYNSSCIIICSTHNLLPSSATCELDTWYKNTHQHIEIGMWRCEDQHDHWNAKEIDFKYCQVTLIFKLIIFKVWPKKLEINLLPTSIAN